MTLQDLFFILTFEHKYICKYENSKYFDGKYIIVNRRHGKSSDTLAEINAIIDQCTFYAYVNNNYDVTIVYN